MTGRLLQRGKVLRFETAQVFRLYSHAFPGISFASDLAMTPGVLGKIRSR